MTVVQSTEQTAAAGTTRRWLILALLATAQLMLVLDVTVVNVALPAIGSALELSRSTVPWVLTTYTLVFGGLMLLGGRVADLLGARRIMLGGLAVFTLSSLMCGLANGPVELLVGRGLQGLGAAFLSPAALSLVMDDFPGPERSKALAVWSTLAGAGSALGVILGGVLTSGIGWRWIFAINVPIGAAILVALPALVPAKRPDGATLRGLDVPGAALVTAGTGAAIYALVNAGTHGWTTPSTLAGLAAGAVLWTAFALVERTAQRPLLTVALLTRRPVAAGAFLMVVATGLLVGGFFLGSFVLQRVNHYSAVHVGLLFLPVAVATIVGAQTGGHLVTRVNTRAIAVTGLALAAAGYASAMQWTGPVGVVVGLSVASLGIGATFVTAFTASLADAGPDESGLRSAIVGTFHEFGGALGVAALATAAGTALTASRVQGDDFTRAFTIGTVCAMVAVLVSAVLVPTVTRAGEVSGHGH
jgi:EmrB/QacA subfamily drug resistance transporter